LLSFPRPHKKSQEQPCCLFESKTWCAAGTSCENFAKFIHTLAKKRVHKTSVYIRPNLAIINLDLHQDYCFKKEPWDFSLNVCWMQVSFFKSTNDIQNHSSEILILIFLEIWQHFKKDAGRKWDCWGSGLEMRRRRGVGWDGVAQEVFNLTYPA